MSKRLDDIKEVCPHHGEFIAKTALGDSYINYPCLSCSALETATQTYWNETFQTALKTLLPNGGNVVLQSRMVADKAALDYFRAQLNHTHSFGPPVVCSLSGGNCFPPLSEVQPQTKEN